jgi:O-antigen ligase
LNKASIIIQRIHHLAICLVAFALVWPQHLAVATIGFWVLTFLISLFIIKPKWAAYKNNLLQPLPILYILCAIGLLYTSNITAGTIDMQLKASMLVFPLIVAHLGFKADYLLNAQKSFLLSCFAAMVGCLGFATYHYTQTGLGAEFFYTRLSVYIHAGYFAMMLNFALVLLYNLWLKQKIDAKVFSLLALLLGIFILMLSTKMGIISLIVVIAYIGLSLWLEKKSLKQAVIVSVSGMALVGLGMVGLPSVNKRITAVSKAIQNKEGDKPGESTASRISVWKDALQAAKTNLPFGAGTGDGKDQLIEQYKASGNTIGIQRNYNAHNQYLQTTIGLGIAGLLLLVASVFTLLYNGIKQKHYGVALFAVLIGLNYLTEAMLERQAGVLFIAFFTALYIAHLFNSKATTTY